MSLHRCSIILGAFLFLAAPLAPAAPTCPAANDQVTPDADLVVNGDGTVTHVKTGLMWKQCVEGQSGAACATGTAATFTWTEALGAAMSANLDGFAGYEDWRLPNKNEVESIIETGCYLPSINASQLPTGPTATFWTSTTYSPAPSTAWYVTFGTGYSASTLKTSSYNVRLVRGGLSSSAFDPLVSGCTLDIDGNGAQDALTDGLLILRAMFGLTGTSVTNGAIGTGPATRNTWARIQPYLNGSCGASFNP